MMDKEATPFGQCPFCKAEIAVEFNEVYQPLSVFHTFPLCREYNRMTADEYLKTVLNIRNAIEEV